MFIWCRDLAKNNDVYRSVGAAIDTARILFRNPERGCRIADSSIAKNLVILLSGEPDNSTKMQKARENFANEVLFQSFSL